MGNPKGTGRPARNRVGERYGHLTALRQVGVNEHAQALWECRCDCGSTVVKSVVALNNGARQCKRECPMGVHVKHRAATREAQTKEYKAWVSMKQRCSNPHSQKYKDYGGRGITVCQEWIDSFEAFLSHVGYAPQGNRISVDRIDNDGNYEPGNVRWATPYQQVMNRRNTKKGSPC